MKDPTHEITAILQKFEQGDRRAVHKLLPLIYDHLKSLARKQLSGERNDHTLNTTALVHEAYLKLVDQTRVNWQNRAHFLAVASRAMRRILVDYARQRLADKRGGGEVVVTLNDDLHRSWNRADQIVALEEALTALHTMDERQCQIVEFRFFGGLSQEEIAEVLEISVATVGREWRSARAWLSQRLK